MKAAKSHSKSRKFRRIGRHTAPSPTAKVARRAGQAAPAVAVVGALAAAPQTAFASTAAPAAPAGHTGLAAQRHPVTRAHSGRGQAAQPSGGAHLHGAHRGHAERDRAAVLRSRQRLAVALSHQPGQDQRPEPDLHRAGVQRPGRPARLGPQRDLPGPARGGHQHGGQPVIGRFGQQFGGQRCIGRIVGQRCAGRVRQCRRAVPRPPVRRLVTACRVRGRRAGWSRPTTPRS